MILTFFQSRHVSGTFNPERKPRRIMKNTIWRKIDIYNILSKNICMMKHYNTKKKKKVKGDTIPSGLKCRFCNHLYHGTKHDAFLTQWPMAMKYEVNTKLVWVVLF